jgi:hypothetical protein
MKSSFAAGILLFLFLSLALASTGMAHPYHKHSYSWYRWHRDINARSPVYGRLEPVFRERNYSNFHRDAHYYYHGLYHSGGHGKYGHGSPAIYTFK